MYYVGQGIDPFYFLFWLSPVGSLGPCMALQRISTRCELAGGYRPKSSTSLVQVHKVQQSWSSRVELFQQAPWPGVRSGGYLLLCIYLVVGPLGLGLVFGSFGAALWANNSISQANACSAMTSFQDYLARAEDSSKQAFKGLYKVL